MHDPNKTQLGAPSTLDPNRTQMGSVGDPNRTVMGSPTFEATVTIKPVQCPVCKTYNPVGVMFCVECGLIFDMALEGDAFGAPAVQLPVFVDPSGRELRLRPGPNVLGRQGDIVIEDTRVSRRHATAHLDGNNVTVEDLGSTNGTSVEGQKLGPGVKSPVGNNATVSLGGFELKLSLPGETNKTLAAASGKTAAIAAAPTTGEIVAWLNLPTGEHALRPGAYTFGRRDSNEIVVADPYVSGSHGTVEVTATEVYFTDTGSTNGTIVNDAKLATGQKTQLRPGDVIKLGQVEVTLRFPG